MADKYIELSEEDIKEALDCVKSFLVYGSVVRIEMPHPYRKPHWNTPPVRMACSIRIGQ